MNMTTNGDQANKYVDQAAHSASEAVLSGQRMAHAAVDGAARRLGQAGDQADALAHRASEAVRRSSQQLREQARLTGDSTLVYIREEPVKAVLIAAATGAVLTVLLRWLSHSRA